MSSSSHAYSDDAIALVRVAQRMIADGREEDDRDERQRIAAIEKSGSEATRVLWEKEQERWIASNQASSGSSSSHKLPPTQIPPPQIPN